MSVVDIVGEREEFESHETVPGSKYIGTLAIGEPGVFENSGSPYIELELNIDEGPFGPQDGEPGVTVGARYILGFGSLVDRNGEPKENPGGVIPLKFGACRQITGQPVDEKVLAEFGFAAPEKLPDEEDANYAKRYRAALCELYNSLAEAQRLDFCLRLLRVAQWEGRKVVASVSFDEQRKFDEVTGQMQGTGRFFNGFEGFYALNHKKWGAEKVRKVCHAEQARAKGDA